MSCSKKLSYFIMIAALILGVVLLVLIFITSDIYPEIMMRRELAIKQREEFVEQQMELDMQIKNENNKELSITLCKLFSTDDLLEMMKSCFRYTIRVNGKTIGKNNILFDIKDNECIIEVIETVNAGSHPAGNDTPREILSEISPLSGKDHMAKPAISVFTTSTPFTFEASEFADKTINRYKFEDIKAGEIFTVHINNKFVQEVLGLETDVIEITHCSQ